VRVISVTVTGFAGNGVETGLARGTKAMLESSIVTQNGGIGVLASGLLLSNSVVSDNGSGGARSAGKPTRIENSQIVGNQGFGISAAQKLKLDGAEVSGNAGHGVQLTRADFEPSLQRAVVRNSTIAANAGDGIRATERPDARLALRLVVLSDNVASGVANVALVKGRDLTIENNGLNGIETSDAEGCRVLLSYATVRTNGFFGATLGPPEAPCAGGRFRASVSTLNGNGVDPDCFVTTACGDIASPTAPTMDGECERSYVSGSGVPGENWSRCALD
jgi:hypothetical protein